MRSSIHLTGRPPIFRDSRPVTIDPGPPPLPPKLPPCGWLIKRTRFDGICSTIAMLIANCDGAW